MGLSQYNDTFKSNNITGDVLLGLDQDSLMEMNVASPFHQMKIMYLIPREVQGSEAKYSINHLSQFLQQQEESHLQKYIPILKKHGIDGDLILNVEEKLMKSVLKEIGVTNAVDRVKICSKYKTFVKQ